MGLGFFHFFCLNVDFLVWARPSLNAGCACGSYRAGLVWGLRERNMLRERERGGGRNVLELEGRESGW